MREIVNGDLRVLNVECSNWITAFVVPNLKDAVFVLRHS